MSVWIANGTHLAWLIDPVDEVNHIFRSDGSADTMQGFGKKMSSQSKVSNSTFHCFNKSK